MKRINVIGLDMDGVLVDLAQYQFDRGIPFFSKRFSIPSDTVVKNPGAYDVEEIFGVSHEDRMRFWNRYIWGYCLWTKPVAGFLNV